MPLGSLKSSEAYRACLFASMVLAHLYKQARVGRGWPSRCNSLCLFLFPYRARLGRNLVYLLAQLDMVALGIGRGRPISLNCLTGILSNTWLTLASSPPIVIHACAIVLNPYWHQALGEAPTRLRSDVGPSCHGRA